MILEVDPRSVVPPYEQLRQQIVALVVGGVLAPGTRLPAIRQLAGDLGLAGGTVARCYRELESDGVVDTRGRHGTVVLGPPSAEAPPSPDLLDAARRYAATAAAVGAGLDVALSAVRAAFVSPRGYDVTDAPYIPAGHPVRRFVLVLVATAAACLLVQWAGFLAPSVTVRIDRHDLVAHEAVVVVTNDRPTAIEVGGITLDGGESTELTLPVPEECDEPLRLRVRTVLGVDRTVEAGGQLPCPR